jgi:hypothetical protein
MSNAPLPPDVVTLLAEGQAALLAERQAERQAEFDRQRAVQALEAEQVTTILTAARALLPEALQDYVSFVPDQDPNAATTYCLLCVPGCVPLRLMISMKYRNGTDARPSGWEPLASQHPAAKLLGLPVADGGGGWTFYKSKYDYRIDYLPQALALAAELAQQIAEDAQQIAEDAHKAEERQQAEEAVEPAPVEPWTAACLKLGEAVCRLIDGRGDYNDEF